MKTGLISGVLTACCIFFSSLPGLAQDRRPPMTPAQKRAYHTCLYSAYINDYCRYNYQGAQSDQQYRECTVANEGGKYPIGYHTWGWGIEDYCRAAVQGSR
jgi:hypothetical protein